MEQNNTNNDPTNWTSQKQTKVMKPEKVFDNDKTMPSDKPPRPYCSKHHVAKQAYGNVWICPKCEVEEMAEWHWR